MGEINFLKSEILNNKNLNAKINVSTNTLKDVNFLNIINWSNPKPSICLRKINDFLNQIHRSHPKPLIFFNPILNH